MFSVPLGRYCLKSATAVRSNWNLWLCIFPINHPFDWP
jgi:hypothetical protein